MSWSSPSASLLLVFIDPIHPVSLPYRSSAVRPEAGKGAGAQRVPAPFTLTEVQALVRVIISSGGTWAT